jgi:hypothetical protein
MKPKPRPRRFTALAEPDLVSAEVHAELRRKAQESTTFYRKIFDPLLTRRSPIYAVRPKKRGSMRVRASRSFGRKPRRT